MQNQIGLLSFKDSFPLVIITAFTQNITYP